MDNKPLYEEITLLIDQAIESEIGEGVAFKAETDSILSEISKKLIEGFNLPEDHHL